MGRERVGVLVLISLGKSNKKAVHTQPSRRIYYLVSSRIQLKERKGVVHLEDILVVCCWRKLMISVTFLWLEVSTSILPISEIEMFERFLGVVRHKQTKKL